MCSVARKLWLYVYAIGESWGKYMHIYLREKCYDSNARENEVKTIRPGENPNFFEITLKYREKRYP